MTKNQFYFFFVFQNYVTEPLSDRSFTVVINHTRPSAQKKSRQFKVFVDVNHLCFRADCMQNLPENMKPCSGPLVKIIISLLACTVSTSLKSINENVCQVFQRSFACMNDLKSKQIYTQANYFGTYFSWGYGLNNTSFCIFFYSLPNYKSFKTFKSCSVCSPKMNTSRNNLFACRFACSRCHIHSWE